jgi:TBC1 domain family protein 5
VKSLQRKLGDSVEWIVDALLQDEESADPAKLKSVREKKREALESLSYVRDVLKGRTTDIDEEQLFNPEVLLKRRTGSGETPLAKPVSPTTPPPVTVAEQRPRVRPSQESLSTQSSFMPSLNSGRRTSQQSPPRSSAIHQGFSRQPTNVGAMPRPPPPTSTVLRPPSYPPTPGDAPPRKMQHDPLGAI